MSVIAPTSPASQTPEGTCGEPEGCWDISELGNGPGAKLDGWELAFTAPFSVFGIDDVPVLKDMGIVANYTSVDSNVEYNYNGNLINAPLLNTSESSYNLTLYYDTDTFSARIAWAYRDAYNQSGPDRSDNLWQFVDDSTYVDFSANYIFNEHWNMTFEILNLTNEKFDLMVDVDARRRLQYNDTGRNYLLGVRYRF
jgi:TonB-dependent receptor